MNAAIQVRIDGVTGCGVPLNPVALADLNDFERRYVLAALRLDDEQVDVAEAAVEAVQAGTYPARGLG